MDILTAQGLKEIPNIIGNIDQWTVTDTPCAQQQDSTSCGVFAIEFAERLKDKNNNFVAKCNVAKKRNDLFTEIACRCYNVSICMKCGNDQPESELITCISCGMKVDVACFRKMPGFKQQRCAICM